MKKFEGVHFYININNLNSIIRKDEYKNDDLTRTFHALDTFTWTLENFVNEFGDIEIEKFTTSRYHFYFSCGVSNNDSKITSLIEIIVFSKTLAKTLAAIGKYQSRRYSAPRRKFKNVCAHRRAHRNQRRLRLRPRRRVYLRNHRRRV